MPNEFDTNKNQLDLFGDSASKENQQDKRQRLASSGFTATVWTLSGVVLAACSLFDDNESIGGNAVSVTASPVQGARVYFDINGDGVVDADDVRIQNEQYPQGFVTGPDGRAVGIPAELFGRKYTADLNGAFDSATGQPLEGQVRSLEDEDGNHLIASPITDLINERATGSTSVNDVVGEFLTQGANTPTPAEVEAFLEELRTPTSYFPGADRSPRVIALSKYLADNQAKEVVGRGESVADQVDEVQRIVEAVETGLAGSDAIVVVNEDTDGNAANGVQVLIDDVGEHDSYIGIINAFAQDGSQLSYSLTATDGSDYSGVYAINARGGISFADGTITPVNVDQNFNVVISNGNPADTQIVEVTIRVDTNVYELDLAEGREVGDTEENMLGASLIEGIEVDSDGAAITSDHFTIRDNALGAFADKFEMMEDQDAWNLKLLDSEWLDYEAIPRGEFELYISVRNDATADMGEHSNILTVTITVTDVNDITFEGGVDDFRARLVEDVDVSGANQLIAEGQVRIVNQDLGGSTLPVVVASGSNTGTTTSGVTTLTLTHGTFTYDHATNAWTYTVDNSANAVQSLVSGESLTEVVTLTITDPSSTISYERSITLNILGTNEDVRFENANNVRVSVANVPDAMNIEIGDETALNGSFALGNVLTDLGVTLRGRLDSNEDTTVTFADSVPTELRALFTLTEGGDLTFTGTSAQALSMLGVGTVELTLLVSTESTTLDVPLTVLVGVVNLIDNDGSGSATYQIDGDTGQVGNVLTAQIVAGGADVDGVIAGSERYQWYRGDDVANGVLIGSGQTYTVQAADVDETITLLVTYIDGSGTTETSEAATTPVRFPTRPSAAELLFAENDGTETLTVSATSSDESGSVDVDSYMFVYTDQNGQEQVSSDYQGFSISNAGVITLTGGTGLDYETASSYDLRIRATDANQEVGHLSITIRVQDVNDNRPAFAQSSYTVTIDETLAVGQPVGVTVAATDDDGTSANNQVTYSVTGGTGMGIFDVNPNSGLITLLSAVDFESGTTSYTLEITATDNGTPARTDTADVMITIRDINDESPTVPNHEATGTARITAAADNPSSGSGTSMGYTVTVSDADASNTLNVRVTDGDPRFEFQRQLNTNTWELYLVAGREIALSELGDTITLEYTVTDGGVGTTPVVNSFTLDVVDTPVSFTGPADRTIDLDEDTTAGSTVHFAVRAESEDNAGQSVGIASYMLLDDTDTATTTYRGFTIDSSSGDITLTGSLDHEDTHADGATITLRVVATDQNTPPETNTLTLTVNVDDVNDNAPVFSQSTYTPPAIDESLAVGAEVARVSATDADGTAANSQVAYSITAGNTGNAFSIDNNGVIRVANPLDFESGTTSYTLEITASDGVAGTIDDTADVTITVNDVNDIVPTYRVTAGENTASVRVTEAGGNSADVGTGYRITITDADTNNVFTGNFDVSDSRFDFVDQGSGVWELTLLANQAVALSEGSLTITYQVNDGENTAAGDRGSVTVAVVDTTVSYTTTQTAPLEIEEADSIDTSTLGTSGVLAQVTAVSSENQPITYTLTSATGNDGSDASSLFRVDSDDGEVRFVSSTVNLDHEDIEEYTLVITASAPQSSTTREMDEVPTNVVIRVTNREEGEATYVVSGNVQASAELTVALASAADEDPDGVNGAVTYRWFERDSAAADPTSITDTNSAITWLTTASTNNAFTLPSTLTAGAVYGVAISYEDGTGKTEFFVELASAFEFLDGTTVLTDSTYRPDPIAENTDSLLTVMPRLESKTTGFRYSFESGNDDGIFAIGTNGEITVATGEELDYEIGGEQHTLRVRVEEVGGDAIGFATVIITVSDVNDNAPEFTPGQVVTARIPESQTATDGTILTITASDDDGTDANKDLTYSITDGNTGSVFYIDPDTGEIRVADNQSLNYDSTPIGISSYTLEISVTDGLDSTGDADTSPDDTLEVTINIDDVNDSAPTVASVGPPGSLTEEAAGVAGGTETDFYVILNDADTNAVNQHDITIDDADLATRFDFVFDSANNRWNLVLLEGQKVDRETDGASLTIAYTITDGSNTPVTGNTAVVNITDINDNKPVVGDAVWASPSFETDGVSEGARAVSQAIFQVTATDDDGDTSFEYRIVSVDGVTYDANGVPDDNSAALFGIDDGTGRVGVLSPLDYEAKSSHEIVIVAVDEGGNGMTSDEKTITVNVQNIDDGDATYTISGDTENNGTLTATLGTADPDGVVAGSLEYRWFILNSDGSIPADGETNGNVGDAASLTLPSDVGTNVYGVVITYMDNAGEPETVTVIASPLRFASSSVSETTPENVGDTVVLATVTATLSTNTAAVPTYTLTDASGKFEINAMGEISLIGSETLDYENTPDLTDGSGNKGYVMTVDATTTDANKTENAPPATVTIIVSDVNDNTPTLAAVSDTATIEENAVGADAGDISFTITDADADATNGFASTSFTITAGTGTTADTAAKFEVVKDGDNWNLKVRDNDGTNPIALDRETDGGTINLNIKVNDGRPTAGDSNEIPVTITVTDLNDFGPEFTDGATREVMIQENLGTGTRVIDPNPATDGDATAAHNSLTYNIVSVSGGGAGFFRLADTSTGEIVLTGPFDYESTPALSDLTKRGYVITLRAQDAGEQDAVQMITVIVEDEDDTDPEFGTLDWGNVGTGTGNTRTIDENTSGTLLTIPISDADTAGASLNVRIVSGNSVDGGEALFIFEKNSANTAAELSVNPNRELNYEDGATYTLELEVSDGTRTATETVTINLNNLNDETPAFTNDPVVTWETGFTNGVIDEDTDGSTSRVLVGRVVVSDADGELGTRTFNFNAAAGGRFEIDTDTATGDGLIYLIAALDREGATPDPEQITGVTITVNDGVNSATSDAFVITIAPVNEFDPVVTPSAASGNMNEQTAASNVETGITFTVADDDAGKVYESADISLSGDSRFDITWDQANQSGTVFLKSGETLNYDDPDSPDRAISLTITATDDNAPNGDSVSHSATVTINVDDVDDVAPVFEVSSFTWQGNAPGAGSGRTINENTDGLIATIDLDDPDTDDVNLDFSIQGGSPTDVNDVEIFTFETVEKSPGSGDYEVRLSINAAADFDYDTALDSLGGTLRGYRLTLAITDGTRTTPHEVTIAVINENDESPTFADPVVSWESGFENGAIAEDTDVSGGRVLVGRVAITDGDDTEFLDDRTFTIAGAGAKFVIERNTDTTANGGTLGEGLIYLTAALDREAATNPDPAEHTGVTITVNDGENPAVTSDPFTISITNVDDENPVLDATHITWNTGDLNVFGVDDSTIRVFERVTVEGITTGAAAGTVLATLAATDPDNLGALSYSIDPATNPQIGGADVFEIVGNELQLKTPLDFEVATTYTIKLIVSDSGGRNDFHDVTINVSNSDEGPAEFADVTSDGDLAAPVVGDTLTFNPAPTTDDPDGNPQAGFTHTWYRQDPTQTGLNGIMTITNPGNTYTLTADDVGKVVGVVVEYDDGGGTQYRGDTGIKVGGVTGTVVADFTVSDGATGMAMQYDPSAVDATGTLVFDTDSAAKVDSTGTYTIETEATYGTAKVVNGVWTYNVNNNDATIKALASGATQTDTFTIGVPLTAAAGGGVQNVDVTVTINGRTDSQVQGTAEADEGDAPNPAIDRSSATGFEVIQGGDLADTITVGDHGSLVIGGYGADHITLGDGVDTVVYRMASLDNNAAGWRADDGGDEIHNFDWGTDKVVFVDTDGTTVSLEDYTDIDTSGVNQEGGITIRAVISASMIGELRIKHPRTVQSDGPKYDMDGKEIIPADDLAGTTFKIFFKDSFDFAEAQAAGWHDGTTDSVEFSTGQLTDFNFLPAYFSDDPANDPGFEIVGLNEFGIDII